MCPGSSLRTPWMMLSDRGVLRKLNRWLTALQLSERSTSGTCRIAFSSEANRSLWPIWA